MLDDKRDGPGAVLIAGTTGSGKSRLAMALARARGGVVINADSMQVYREMRILTARPSVGDEASCPHRLYGHVDLAQAYSVGMWLEEATAAISEVRAQGLLPIVVGGTGLYFRALTEGLAPVPEIAANVRAHWRREGAGAPIDELYAMLEKRDPVMACRLGPSDRQRIIRALEVIEGTGRSLADWQRVNSAPVLEPGTYAGLVVDRPRAETYGACDARFDEMVAGGALDEARRVRDMQLDRALPGMRALGLVPLIAHLDGEMALEDAVLQAKQDTRNYVKRQLTWLRRNMIAWKPVYSEDKERISVKAFSFIDG